MSAISAKAFEDGDERSGDLALGIRFGITGQTGRCGPQPDQQFGWRSLPVTGVRGHEAGEALLTETAGAVGLGTAADKSQGDWAVEGDENRGGAWPEF